MRIVTGVWSTSPTGGVEINSFQVGRELATRGHELHLLFMEEGSLLPEYRTFCRSVTKRRRLEHWYQDAPRMTLRQTVGMAPTVWTALRRRPDIIYGNRFATACWSVPSAKARGVPLVLHNHGYGKLSPERTAWLNRNTDRFLVVSQFVADQWVEAGLDATKIDVIHNGVAPTEYPRGKALERSRSREALGLGDDLFVVTFSGRLDPEKGVDVLLHAWAQLGLGPNEAQLLIVGSPVVTADGAAYQRQLEALATSSVRFVPMQRDVVSFLHAADVIAVPSVCDESCPRVVIEGLATGRPVVASNVGGVPELLTGELAKYLFERGNATALAEQLGGLVGWARRQPELGDTCEALVREKFSLSRMVDGIERAFALVTDAR